MNLHGLGGSLILSAVSALTLSTRVPARDETEPVHRLLAQHAASPSYRATRRLEATGGGQHGRLDARTDFTPTAVWITR